jgi:uncharacterized membrane protein YbaN (DUF454 family)
MSRKSKFLATWKTLPRQLRKVIVSVIGFTLITIGLLLIVLPGPFTLPFLILGLVVLGLEFAWAERMLDQVKSQGKKVDPRKLLKRKPKNPEPN